MSKLTIGITSYNRGKYLEVLLRSIEQECIQNNYELILIDNFSSEQRVFDAIKKYDHIITKKILRVETDNEHQNYINDEYIAKNLIITNASNDVILFLQDDQQYIGYDGLLQRYLQEFVRSNYYCMTLNAVRYSTLEKTLEKFAFGNDIHYCPIIDNHYHTMGFFKKIVFDNLGLYRVDFPLEKMYWGAGEIEYDLRIKMRSNIETISCTTFIPLFIPVWNDSRGGYAFLRNQKRYGEYHSPDNDLYYQKLTTQTFQTLDNIKQPISFGSLTQEAFCKPINWQLKRDEYSEPYKYPQSSVLLEGPISDIND